MHRFFFTLFVVLFSTSSIFSQQSLNDTIPSYSLSDIVISANRYESQLVKSTASLSKLKLSNISNYPVEDLTGTLALVPGFYVASLDGLGKNSVITSRGFYGGGEAEYINLYVEGIEINDSEDGLVDWQFVPAKSLGSVEYLRGGSSSLYGDASIGGVINVANKSTSESTMLNINGGNYGQVSGGVYKDGYFGKSKYNIYFNHGRHEGFREKSEWSNFSFGGTVKIPLNENLDLKLISLNQIGKNDIPGPLSENEVDDNREQSSSYYKYDSKDTKKFIGAVSLDYHLSTLSNIAVQFGLKSKDSENIQSFTNSVPIVNPQDFSILGVYDTTLFADTKQREFSSKDFMGRILYKNFIKEISTDLILGVESDFVDYSTSYYNFFNGFAIDYNNSNASRGDKIFEADGSRLELGIFLNSNVHITEYLTLNIGLRYDRIEDEFNSSMPDSSISSDNDALSPKVGLNYVYANSPEYRGSIYANYNKSFKAPTIDQLTDLNQLDFLIYVPAGPDSYMPFPYKAEPFANSDLKPQKSNNFEIGTYQNVRINDNITVNLVLSLYQIDVKDEIDFDLNTFRYQNIAESRHRGIEFGTKVVSTIGISGFANYTFSEVEFQSGQNKGNQLKGIPKHTFNVGAGYVSKLGIFGSLTLSSVNDIFLDDENTAELDNYVFVNGKIGYEISNTRFTLSVMNLFDNEYNSAGFLLNGVKYFYPASGRSIIFGASYNF